MAKELMLMEDVPGLGIEGDVVHVADGYARNYLLPKKIAAPVSALSRRQFEARQKSREARLVEEREQAEAAVHKLRDASVTLPMKAGPEGKLYGSVGSADIAQALEGLGVKIDRRKVALSEPLKELGVFEVPLRLHPEIQTTVKVWIVEE